MPVLQVGVGFVEPGRPDEQPDDGNDEAKDDEAHAILHAACGGVCGWQSVFTERRLTRA
jgi:hypothetical protein